jgi:hypothetical protein
VYKRFAVLVLVLVLGAFVGGYWPQRQGLLQARNESAQLRRQLAEAQAQASRLEGRGRLVGLFGRYLALRDAVWSRNFGAAQSLSSPFFDAVRDEAGRLSEAETRKRLDEILAKRDLVTARLARSEASVQEPLDAIERELRRALGFPLPPEPPAAGGPAGS